MDSRVSTPTTNMTQAHSTGTESVSPSDILASLPCAVLVTNASLGLVYRNRAADQWATHDRRIDSALADLRMLDDFDGWETEIARALRLGISRTALVSLNSKATGEMCLVEMLLQPMECEGHNAGSYVLVMLDDASDRKDIEQRLEVAERLAAIGKLAARVAHELNNPLDGILRYINLALRVVDDVPESKLRSYLDESRTGVMRMVEIIGDLLEFSRSTQGEFDLIGINEVVEQAIEAFAENAKSANVVIAADFQNDDLPGVRGGRLHQVLCNLFRNAIEAISGGGRLMISTGIVGEDVVIRVADSGPGLPDPPARVFEPFFTTKAPGKGTGLGLAICKDFIENMGGSIQAANATDAGAVFTIRLPVSKCHRKDAATSPLKGEQ